jgi:hypothetical protein
LLIT